MLPCPHNAGQITGANLTVAGRESEFAVATFREECGVSEQYIEVVDITIGRQAKVRFGDWK